MFYIEENDDVDRIIDMFAEYDAEEKHYYEAEAKRYYEAEAKTHLLKKDETMTKYYIIERNNVGPYQDMDASADKIEISTSPAIANLSREARTDGWCGTTNNWAVYAHGEYATIEEARAAIAEKFVEVRCTDDFGDSFESDDESVVETYKPVRS